MPVIFYQRLRNSAREIDRADILSAKRMSLRIVGAIRRACRIRLRIISVYLYFNNNKRFQSSFMQFQVSPGCTFLVHHAIPK